MPLLIVTGRYHRSLFALAIRQRRQLSCLPACLFASRSIKFDDGPPPIPRRAATTISSSHRATLAGHSAAAAAAAAAAPDMQMKSRELDGGQGGGKKGSI